MALKRLQQTIHHLQDSGGGQNGPVPGPPPPLSLSLVHGPTEPALLRLSMGQLLEEQSGKFPDRDAIVIPWTGVRLSFRQLNDRSKLVARGLLALGVSSQDRVGVFSGNCERYVELFFATCRIGAVFVVLNPAYTPVECRHALRHSGCKFLFTALDVGRKSQIPLLKNLVDVLESTSASLPDLKGVVMIRGKNPFEGHFTTYDDLIRRAPTVAVKTVDDLTTSVNCHDICNFQYTSGTTGEPKATMLSHYNVINNGLFIGHVMRYRRGEDVICCPPPLYHAFGLVLGLLACYTHGVTIVYPSWNFEPAAVLRAVIGENCTGLLGVPTMLSATLQQYRLDKKVLGPIQLRTGIAAGSPVPRYLMEELQEAFGLPELVIIYGMTEVSGASFITSVDDGMEEKLSSVGRVTPHTSAKVVGPDGQIVPCGVRGELCMAGFGVQRGYYQNREKTDELMIRDQDGVVWVHSGDEATLDTRGYCKITGRIKDMIIRGGENIYPFEIEQRLGQHSAVSQASVVGLKDDKYGEVVSAFLEQSTNSSSSSSSSSSTQRPPDEELREWVRKTLGRYNAPVYIFWVGGEEAHIDDFPKTSSGKIKKVDLRNIGNAFIGKK